MTNASKEETLVTATQTASAEADDAYRMPEVNTSWVEKYPVEFREVLLNLGVDDTDDDCSRRINERIIALESDTTGGEWFSKHSLERIYEHAAEEEEDYGLSGMTDRMTFDEFYEFADYILEVAVYRDWRLPDAEAVRKKRRALIDIDCCRRSIELVGDRSERVVGLYNGEELFIANVKHPDAADFVARFLGEGTPRK